MIEPLGLLLAVLRACLRTRSDLVIENLLLRHQLAVALRSRPRPAALLGGGAPAARSGAHG